MRFPVPRVLLFAVLAVALAGAATSAGAQTETDDDLAYEVLTDLTNEPLSLEIADDGRLIWAQRDGTVWVLTPGGVQILAANIPVNGTLCELCEIDPFHQQTRTDIGGTDEGGLHGLLLDDDFTDNGIIYTYRSVPDSRDPETTMGIWRVATYVLDHDTNLIDLSTEETILEVEAEWDHCCHYAGDLDYLPDGTITLTTGDDALAEASEGYGPRDHTTIWTNAELTSANPADRRGKILRFTEAGEAPDGETVVNPDTGQPYAANPFIGWEGYIPDTLSTDEQWVPFDPYVYSMGWKQPWRAVVHPSGTMYVSDIGPDSSVEDPDRGPVGYEEINMVPAGGGTHAGWPRCVGPNYAYTDVNWETMEVGEPLDCSEDALVARPIGSLDEAEWRRGMHPAEFYYPAGASEEWPIVDNGGVGKTSEPVAFYPADTTGELRLPERFNDRLLVLEWSRNFILAIPSDPDTGELNLDNDDMFLVSPPNTSINTRGDNPYGTVSAMQGQLMSPADGEVGPDGAFYFLEYGASFYAGENGRVSRITCAGCSPADPATNYGLPLDRDAPDVAATTSRSAASPTVTAVIASLLAAGAMTARRRHRLT